MDLGFFLEELFGRKVDLLTPESLSPYIGPYILKEAEDVPFDSPYLLHIRDEIEFLMTSAQGIDEDRFLANEVLKRAFVRSLEVIGETVKQLPMPLREQYPQAPWRASAGMRDRLIHGYATVDYEIV